MSDDAMKLLEQVQALPENDRMEIAEALAVFLNEDPMDDPEFREELARRLDSASNGTAKMIPAKEAIQSLSEMLTRRQELHNVEAIS